MARFPHARFSSCLLVAALCSSALPSMAAETSTWQGGESGIWGVGYEGNWSVYPDSTRYAFFGSPNAQTITVTVNEAVDAYGVVGSANRTAGLNFTGSGTLNNYRGDLYNPKSRITRPLFVLR